MQKVLHMSTKNALITKIWKKLKTLSQIDVLSSPKCSPFYYAFHFKAVLILSKIKSFACESGVKKRFVVRCIILKKKNFCFDFIIYAYRLFAKRSPFFIFVLLSKWKKKIYIKKTKFIIFSPTIFIILKVL